MVRGDASVPKQGSQDLPHSTVTYSPLPGPWSQGHTSLSLFRWPVPCKNQVQWRTCWGPLMVSVTCVISGLLGGAFCLRFNAHPASSGQMPEFSTARGVSAGQSGLSHAVTVSRSHVGFPVQVPPEKPLAQLGWHHSVFLHVSGYWSRHRLLRLAYTSTHSFSLFLT